MIPMIEGRLLKLLKNGVTEKEIEKSLTATEVQVINGLATALNKGISLATFYNYTGDPNTINKQMDLYKGITPAEVLAVAKKYLTPPKVTLSVVPLGKTELAVQKGQ